MKQSKTLGSALLVASLMHAIVSSAETIPMLGYSVAFGAAADLAPECTTTGGGGDSRCDRGIDIENGTRDASARFRVRAQASADVTGGINRSNSASASVQIDYRVPFTVTRQIRIVALDGQYVAVAPELSLQMNYDYAAVAATRDEAGRGKERADVGKLTLTLTDADPWTVGTRGQTGESGINRNVAQGEASRSITLATGSTGEVGSLAEIPLSFDFWNDDLPPLVDYTANDLFEQTYSGVVGVQLTLSAQSTNIASYLGSNGGEAIACFGSGSGLSGFVLDDGGCPVGLRIGLDPVDDGGLEISADVKQTAIAIARIGPVPIPAALWLFGTGLLGMGIVLGREVVL